MRRLDTDCWWMHSFAWDIAEMEARIEINPLDIGIGVFLGPLGMRACIPFLAFGLVWGPRFNSEEHERAALKALKRKYEK